MDVATNTPAQAAAVLPFSGAQESDVDKSLAEKKKAQEEKKPPPKAVVDKKEATLDLSRPLDDGKIGQPTPAPKKSRGKPFSMERQLVLKDLGDRLTKARVQLAEAKANVRKLNEKVNALDGSLMEELRSQTDLLPFKGYMRVGGSPKPKSGKKYKATAKATGSKNKRDARGKPTAKKKKQGKK